MDFIKLAESFGATGYKISKKEEFKSKLDEVIQKSGVQIIDLDFDYPEDGVIC
jgi:acetolactate synthase-1/2/3 large subunit